MAIEIGHKLKKNDRIIVYQPNNHRAFKSGTLKGYVYEHIYNAEQKLGRWITDTEVIHHIDGNKINNTPSNLIVLHTAQDHALLHGHNLTLEDLVLLDDGSYKVPDDMFDMVKYGAHNRSRTEAVCAYCGKRFARVDFRRTKSGKIYCSIQCVNKAKRKEIKATPEILLSQVKELRTFKQVGAIYGVSAQVIRSRLEEAGLLDEVKPYIRYH